MPKWLPYALVGGLILLALLVGPMLGPVTREIPYSRFKQLITNGQVEQVTLKGDQAIVTLTEPIPAGPLDEPTRNVVVWVPEIGDPNLVPLLEESGIEVPSRARRQHPCASSSGSCPGSS